MPADLEHLQAKLLGLGFSELMGAELVAIDEGFARVKLPFKPELSRGDELIHGGAIAALVDKAGTAAAWSYADIGPTARGATISLAVNYLRGAVSCDLTADGRVVRRGGTITVVDVEVHDADGQLVAKGPVTYKLSNY